MQFRENFSDVVDDLDGIRSRLPRDGQKESAPSIVPGDCFVVLDAVDDVGKFLEPQGNTIAPLDDQRPICGGLCKLSGRLHREGLLGAPQAACRQIHIALLDGTLDFVDSHLVRREPVGIDLDAYRIFLSAKDLHA